MSAGHDVTPRQASAERRMRQLLDAGELDVPDPGGGKTRRRFGTLRRLAATEDLSVGRLAEAHCDAAAITREAGQSLPHGALAGVWASKFRGSGITAKPDGDGWRLTGALRFCSGAPLLDVALVDASIDDGSGPYQLFLVPLRGGGIDVDTGSWASAGLAATATGGVEMDVRVDDDSAIGAPGYYLERPGFWHGAVGVAACWAGGADGVHAAGRRTVDDDDPHAAANIGRSAAACWAMTALLDQAADEIDRDPTRPAMPMALTVRHLVAAHCRDVIDDVQRAIGPGPFAFDGEFAQRVADVRLYIEQHHHEADLAEIGRADPGEAESLPRAGRSDGGKIGT